MNKTIVWIALIVVCVLGGGWWLMSRTGDTLRAPYNPVITPNDFSSTVDNPYFKLVPGTRYMYEGKKAGGVERIEITVLSKTRQVMGVETRVVRDQVFLNGSLIEDTLDWYAQDTEGNVWYFGEDTAEYDDGVITSHHGAWEAGVDGALPGMVMKAHPKVGEMYRQEYYAGIAEDMAEILSITDRVGVPFGTYENCVKTFDYTPLDPKSLENKYYCKETGFTTLEIDTTDGERTELINIEKGVVEPAAELTPSASTQTGTAAPSMTSSNGEGSTGGSGTTIPKKLSEEQAKAAALVRVPGTVSSISVEAPFDKPLYVVEIKPAGGDVEVDVSVDMYTGAILSVGN